MCNTKRQKREGTSGVLVSSKNSNVMIAITSKHDKLDKLDKAHFDL